MSILQNVSSSVIGGDVVGILIRQATLTAALNLINLGQGSSGWMGNPIPKIAGVAVNTRQQEVYEYTAEVTRHTAEDGSVYSDHVIRYPIKIELVFEVSNFMPGIPANSLNLFETIFHQGLPVQLFTTCKIVKDAVIASLRAENQLPEWGKLAFRAVFQAVHYATLETVPLTKAQVKSAAKTSGPDRTKTAEPATQSGQQTLRQATAFSGDTGIFNNTPTINPNSSLLMMTPTINPNGGRMMMSP